MLNRLTTWIIIVAVAGVLVSFLTGCASTPKEDIPSKICTERKFVHFVKGVHQEITILECKTEDYLPSRNAPMPGEVRRERSYH